MDFKTFMLSLAFNLFAQGLPVGLAVYFGIRLNYRSEKKFDKILEALESKTRKSSKAEVD